MRIDTLIADWFDLYNRRGSQGRVTKEQVTLGVYDHLLTEAAKALMSIRTHSVSCEDLTTFFATYGNFRDPFIASLFLQRVNTKVNKKGRDALMFSPAIKTEYYKEGFWLACALIHDPSQILTWRLFMQWLLQAAYYDEDEQVCSIFLSVPAPDFAARCPLVYDPSLSCAVYKERTGLPLPLSLNAIFSYLLQSHRAALLQYVPTIIPSMTPQPDMSCLAVQPSLVAESQLLLPFKSILEVMMCNALTTSPYSPQVRLAREANS